MTEPVMPMDSAAWVDSNKRLEPVIDPLSVLHLLRSAGSGLLMQLGLYGQLASVEWALEKKRLFSVLATGLLGFAFLLCLLALMIVLVLALSWDTPYRISAVLCLLLLFAAAFALTWRHFQSLQAKGQQAFFATREEFSADMALMKEALLRDHS